MSVSPGVRRPLVPAALLLLSCIGSTEAQQIRVDAGLGGVLGLARYGQLLPSGFAGQVGAEASIGSGFAATVDVEHARFQGDGDLLTLDRLRQTLTTARLGLRYRPPIAGGWRPYLLGGVGIGRRGRLEVFDQSVTGMTLHAGGGIEAAIGRGAVFAESRYQTLLLVGRDQEQLALIVGVRTGQAPRHAAPATDAPTSTWARRRIGVAAATTLHQPTIMSPTAGRPIHFVAAQGSWLLVGGPQNALEYTAELLPLVIGRTSEAPGDFGRDEILAPSGSPTVATTGVGILPVGVRGLVGVAGSLRATVELSAGLLIFDRNVPLGLGRRANFAFGGAAGVEQRVTPGWSATAAYRFLHYSNARSSELNAGADFGMLQLGARRTW